MELAQARHLAISLIREHLSDEWTFSWINAKKVYGQCNYVRKQILLSKVLTIHRSENAVRQTILHEIAHALAPGHGHNRVWRKVAESLGVQRPRSTSAIDFDQSKIPYTWAIMYNGEIVRGYHRKPNKTTIQQLPNMRLKDNPASLGKLTLVKM